MVVGPKTLNRIDFRGLVITIGAHDAAVISITAGAIGGIVNIGEVHSPPRLLSAKRITDCHDLQSTTPPLSSKTTPNRLLVIDIIIPTAPPNNDSNAIPFSTITV